MYIVIGKRHKLRYHFDLQDLAMYRKIHTLVDKL